MDPTREHILSFYRRGTFTKDRVLECAKEDDVSVLLDSFFKSNAKEYRFHLALARASRDLSLWQILTTLANIYPAAKHSASVIAIEEYFTYQHIPFVAIADVFWMWLNHSKRPYCDKKTLRFIGPTKTGKSMMINLLSSHLNCDYISNSESAQNFQFSDSSFKNAIVWEEMMCDRISAQECKKLLSGDPIHVDKKFQSKQTVIGKPCLISTNHEDFGQHKLTTQDEAALKRRVVDIRLNHPWQMNQAPMCTGGLLGFILKYKLAH